MPCSCATNHSLPPPLFPLPLCLPLFLDPTRPPSPTPFPIPRFFALTGDGGAVGQGAGGVPGQLLLLALRCAGGGHGLPQG